MTATDTKKRTQNKSLANLLGLEWTSLLFAGSSLGAILFAFLYHFAMSRVLSVADYGLLGLLLALFLVLGVPRTTIRLGTSRQVAAMIANESPSEVLLWLKRILGRVSLIIFLPLLIALPIIPSLASVLKAQSPMPFVWLGLGIVVSLYLPFAVGTLQGAQQLTKLSLITVFEPFGKLVLGFSLALLGFGVSGAMAGITISVFLVLVWGLGQCWAHFKSTGVPKQSASKAAQVDATSLTRRSSWLPILLLNGLIMILYSVGSVSSRYYLLPTQSGEFAVIATLASVIFFLPNFLNAIMGPRVTSAHVKGLQPRKYLWFSVLLTSFLGVLILGLYYLFSEPLIEILFGSRYVTPATVSLVAPYGLALLGLAVIRLLGNYWLSKYETGFLWGLGVGVAFLIPVLPLRHRTIGDLVFDLLGAIVLALSLMVLAKLLSSKRIPAPGEVTKPL